jgi:protein-disulfide isomerase
MSQKSKPATTTPQPAAPVRAPQAATSRRRRFMVAGGAVLLAAAAAALLLPRGAPAPDPLAQRPGLASDHAPTLGPAGAKVHIVEFLDPACETCATFYPLVKQMMAQHPERIRLSMRHVPFHPGSGPVVAMLEASRQQGKYWQALEALLGAQGLWVSNHVAQPEVARQLLAGLGLNMEQLAADMQAAEVAQRMAQDSRDADALEVTKTPEFFVNGRQMASFGRQQLQNLIREAVQRAY